MKLSVQIVLRFGPQCPQRLPGSANRPQLPYLLPEEPPMTPAETNILTFFRRYGARPTQMLFFNPNDCKMSPAPFRAAMESLMRQGFVIKERPKLAYSLTRDGYDLSMSVAAPRQAPSSRAAKKGAKTLANR
jgi:hypothetical protein